MTKRGYHHGNLRAALIDGCLRLIEMRGPTGFTLSEAAREAGVTPAAVYRHFAGREDLIAAAAQEGYGIFADLMDHAFADGQPSALAAFGATGRAYLAFARRYPGHYIAMFESGVSINHSPELHAVATRAMGVLEKAAAALSQHIPPDKRPPAQMFSAHIWAMSHGVVELFARGNPGRTSPFPPDDLLETGIGIYLRGLGLLDPDRQDHIMDGTFAIIFFITGLTDTYLNACPTGCYQLQEAPARAAVQISDVVFQDDSISEEIYVTYDLARRYGVFQPVIGASATSDGSLWVGAGAKWTTQKVIDGPFFVEASFMPGLYAQGDGPDLGLPLEFRSALGVGYAFDNGATLSVLADHRSNGDLKDLNPGLETLGLRFAMVLD